MTSNLGAESFRRTAFGFGESPPETVQHHFEREVKSFLRPEMFNRLDRIVPFVALSAETIGRIAQREMSRIVNRDGLRLRNVTFDISEDAIKHLAASGFDPRYGARPLRRAAEQQFVAPLANQLCRYSREVPLE